MAFRFHFLCIPPTVAQRFTGGRNLTGRFSAAEICNGLPIILVIITVMTPIIIYYYYHILISELYKGEAFVLQWACVDRLMMMMDNEQLTSNMCRHRIAPFRFAVATCMWGRYLWSLLSMRARTALTLSLSLVSPGSLMGMRADRVSLLYLLA